MKIFKNKLLLAILILAAILRFYNLGNYPALNADEAAIGYNVYSLLETGMDEHGNPWPIHFQSFDDYKPGGYFYIAMPFVWLLGLNPWSVRMPGAIIGVLSVYVIYLLGKEIRKDDKTAIAAAFLLAISPWHIHFSRGGWEVNVATFFVMLGVYFFIKGVRDGKYFALSVLSFAVSLYTYHAARVLVPIIGLSLVILFRDKIFSKSSRKLFLGSMLLGAVVLVPLIIDFVGGAGQSRASGVSILADSGYVDRINEKRGRYENIESPIAKLAHNKPKEIFFEFSSNYFEHFWGEFLFISGDDIQRNKVPDVGQLYIFQIPLLLVSFVFVSKSSKKRNWFVVLLWLLAAPVPAALTFQSPHALRAHSMVIPLTLLSAYGAVSMFSVLNRSGAIVRKSALIFSLIFLVWSFGRYVHQYYVHMAKAYPYSSQYGLSELVDYVETNKDKYDEFIITTRYDQPYIMYLFYSKYLPKVFQNGHVLTEHDVFGFSTVNRFDKFLFKPIDFEDDKKQHGGSMIIGTDEEIPDEANIVHEIYGSNGYLYFQAVAN